MTTTGPSPLLHHRDDVRTNKKTVANCVGTMSELFQNYAKNMPELCMSELHENYANTMSEIHQNRVRMLLETCQNYARAMSEL